MNTRLHNFLERLRASFWFIPALMLIGAIILSQVAILIDRNLTQQGLTPEINWIYQNDAQGSRMVLSTIAGSMITVAGVVFSITIAALVQASSQFGPRLLTNFIRDRNNQMVLGTFTSTFLYCLLVLRTINNQEDGGSFIPHYAVFTGVLLAVFSIAVLVFFIHHMASSIHASFVISLVGSDLDDGIDRLIPRRSGKDEDGTDHPDAVLPERFEEDSAEIEAERNGYLQAIDRHTLKEIAREEELVMEIVRKPGDFIIHKSTLARIFPSDRKSDDLVKRINAQFLQGRNRTAEQDIRFQINQLAEVAVRALSPGVNDPFTTITCIDWLGVALCKLVERPTPQARYLNEDKKLSLLLPVVTFDEALDAAFAQIQHYGRENRVVTVHLLEILIHIARRARRQDDREAIRTEVEAIQTEAMEALRDEKDRELVKSLCQEAFDLLDEK